MKFFPVATLVVVLAVAHGKACFHQFKKTVFDTCNVFLILHIDCKIYKLICPF